MSSAVIGDFSTSRAIWAARSASPPRIEDIRFVLKYDGQTTVQPTPYGASSCAAVSLNATTAAFTAL